MVEPSNPSTPSPFTFIEPFNPLNSDDVEDRSWEEGDVIDPSGWVECCLC